MVRHLRIPWIRSILSSASWAYRCMLILLSTVLVLLRPSSPSSGGPLRIDSSGSPLVVGVLGLLVGLNYLERANVFLERIPCRRRWTSELTVLFLWTFDSILTLCIGDWIACSFVANPTPQGQARLLATSLPGHLLLALQLAAVGSLSLCLMKSMPSRTIIVAFVGWILPYMVQGHWTWAIIGAGHGPGGVGMIGVPCPSRILGALAWILSSAIVRLGPGLPSAQKTWRKREARCRRL